MEEEKKRPVLFVDAYNLFLRSFAAFPSMSSHGYQIGGAVGFLKTLKKLVSEIFPSAIYVCWESGGSARRRALFSEYKAHRKPEKLNRFYEDDIPETAENRTVQVAALAKLLRQLPVCQIHVSECEADDVIAHLCKVFYDRDKVIASSDKDYYQLLDDKTRIYSFHKKTYYTAEDVQRETGINVRNFALAKAVCGDASDNIPGVDGIGFKTLVKRFPIFMSDEDITIDNVVAYAQSRTKEAKAYRSLVEQADIIKRNWELIYLGGGSLAPLQIERIDHQVGTFKPAANKIELIRRLITEGIQGFEVDNFFLAFLGVTYE